MIKLSSKIVSTIVAVAAVGTISVTAATANHPAAVANTSSQASSIVSSTVSSAPSSAPESKGEVKTVGDGVSAIQKATDDGVSKIKDETGKAVSEVDSETAAKQKADGAAALASVKYLVVDPDTLDLVGPDNAKYNQICQSLGGDAGKVPTDKSTACAPYVKARQDKFNKIGGANPAK